MYENHVACYSPPNEDTPIWRYMKFTEFVSLLFENALFFTVASKFEDPSEGYPTKRMRGPNSVELGFRLARSCIEASCWSMGEDEISGMWDRKGPEGVAIKSTVRRLKESLAQEPLPVWVSVIRYIDFDKDTYGVDDLIRPFIHKNKQYSWERELRALTYDPLLLVDDQAYPLVPGRLLKCDVKTLVETVVLAPRAPRWFHRLALKIMKAMELHIPVRESALAYDPSHLDQFLGHLKQEDP